MRKLIIVLCFLVFACEEEKHPILVDDSKAIALLFDLNIANVALDKYPMNMRDSVSEIYNAQICDIHNLNKVELDTILWMLQNDFDRYNKLYAALVDSLEELQDKLGEVAPGTEMKKYNEVMDSIRNR